MIVDGKKIAQDIYTQLEKQAGSRPTLVIVVVGDNPVIASFVRIKKKNAARLGVGVIEKLLPSSATTEDCVLAISECAATSNGIIVQLPLPNHIDTETVLAAIPHEQDVDGIYPISTLDRANAVFVSNTIPPVAAALDEIIHTYSIKVSGKSAVVVGAGRLVGKPCAALLVSRGAQITILSHGDSLEKLKTADIIVLGAGSPGFVKPEMIKEGVVLIDAGTSEDGGKMLGDADSECASKCSLFTPVPGGIGPIAVAMIFKNLFALTTLQTK